MASQKQTKPEHVNAPPADPRSNTPTRIGKPLESALANKLKSASAKKPASEPAQDALSVIADKPIPPRDGAEPCAYCKNLRYVIGANGEMTPCPKCGAPRQWKVDALKAYSSLSGVATNQTLFNFKTAFKGAKDDGLVNCLQAAEDFAEHPDQRWLVMWGERGSGKSHLCAAVANHLIGAGTPALFITAPDLLAALKEAMDLQTNTEQESYSGRLKMVKIAPVLILDDLGAESASAWSDGVIFEVIDYRYRQRLPTMIATNVSLDEFDPRVASRMQDAAFVTVVENAAPDFRRRAVGER